MQTVKQFILIFVIGFAAPTIFANPVNIPVKDFFKNPEFSQLQISPNGKYLAVLSPLNDRRNIVVMDVEGLKNIRALTALKKQDIATFFWANNNDIVFTTDSDGNEAFSLFAIARDGKSRIKELVGSDAGSSGIKSASVVHRLPEDPEHILVQFNGRQIKSADLYKLPIDSRWNARRRKNSAMKMIARNPGDVQGWIVDNDGDVRGAISVKGVRAKFHYKAKGEKDFRVLRDVSIFDEGINPLGFAYDNKMMYVTSNIGRDRNAIYKFDPEKNELGEMIYGHDEVDVGGLIMSRKQQKLIGVNYFDDYPNVVFFDEDAKKQYKNISGAFPDKRVNITSQSKDEMLQVLLVNDDQDPGNYYLYDKATGKIKFLLAVNKAINSDQMSEMKPIRFTSRDGLTIRGYLTTPKNSDGKMLPLIVNPHGGPFGVRDFWGYNPEHQFFASRGYATVQVTYRGSGGYGRNFQQAGFGGKWGAEMQNDLTDTVKYLIGEGIVDPKRVCIYGASYGGYATMAGLTFTPELYKCGINYVGVTDVGLLFSSMPKHWEPLKDVMKVQIGDPDDKELMNRMSPLAHVDRIKAPLMIIQGAKDPRVVKQHAIDLRDALEDRGITLSDDEWIMKKNEGHGFRKEENRIELYEKIDLFLGKHLK
ncbi:MAG: S9 family peptidase [Kangiellaceae bacterium]|nr:S9 family peptidase [Kangiellaceae bacterium]